MGVDDSEVVMEESKLKVKPKPEYIEDEGEKIGEWNYEYIDANGKIVNL